MAISFLFNWSTWQFLGTWYAVFLVLRTIYRLTLHPLAKFPGPRLAAITRNYEAYYDCVLRGQYTFKIGELHQKYGPIIRISPFELHISDPAFFDQVYSREGRWNKNELSVGGWAAPKTTIFTIDHDLHKNRRQALNPYFSKSRVADFYPIIKSHAVQLHDRLSEFNGTSDIAHLGAAITAITRDIANDFVFRKHYDSLGQPDFDIFTTTAGDGTGQMWRVGKHIPWFVPLLKSIPKGFIRLFEDDNLKKFLDNYQEAMDDTKMLHDNATALHPDPNIPRNLVGDIVRSKLPDSQKTFERIFEDVSSIAGAGFETTASALRLMVFHVYTNPDVLAKARAELTQAGIGAPDETNLKVLEQLPYLNAIVLEGIRLSPALATRMGRVAPDRDIFYKEWRIPAGTPFGMTQILFHTDEKYYPEPQRYLPDRWTDPESKLRDDVLFAPFSRGRRNCVGMHLAWANLYAIMATLIQNFDFEFIGASAEDYACSVDDFAVGTTGKGVLDAKVTARA